MHNRTILKGGLAAMKRHSDNRERQLAENRRTAERIDLGNRLAKVVSQSGEYLCQLRDLSSLGIGLGFLHSAPPDPRVLLQIENGLTFPIERVWSGKSQAGYRFASTVKLGDFKRDSGEHERRPIRLNFSAPAEIADGNRSVPVELVNLSCEGLQFASREQHELGRVLRVSLADGPQMLGQIRWKDGDRYGMKLQHALSPNELAQIALALQPMKAPFQTAKAFAA